MDRRAMSDHLKFTTAGQLPPEVYAEITRLAGTAAADVVEVGTATGAATIALAQGAPAGLEVNTIDRWNTPTWQRRYGDVAAVNAQVLANFERFGVRDRINVFVGDADAVAGAIDTSGGIGMLVLDADGALDRDFRLFYDRLLPGAPIVIDDFRPDHVGVVTLDRRRARVDQKQRLVALLTEYFETLGLITRARLIRHTWFGHKTTDGATFALADPEALLKIYRQLTFARGEMTSQRLLNLANAIKVKLPTVYAYAYKLRERGRR